MDPTERTLQVLEYIMAAGPGPVKQVDIARHCGLSPSTLNRIVKALSDWGYLFRTSEKYCVRNFRLERNVPMSQTYLAKLDSTMRDLSHRLGVSAEVIVVAGHELLWHSKTDHPDPNVLIRAGVGFRRSLYELDVLSVLYLSRLAWSEIEARFFADGFFETLRKPGQPTRWLSAAKVRDRLERMRSEVFAADTAGNHVGIRRCATVIEDPNGRFLHLLALAEPDDRSDDRMDEYRDALLSVRAELSDLAYAESATNRLVPKHHSMPLRGG
ncbi:MarR family transcriptional regulator [Tropicimonas sediminicola]|uniref:DNA-binding transcriptional regulator, IclR family n=1 Tax=Tropicimonas sediminicola TaxID=1031541 RepID=A0A239HS91_9RHOB|nr:MarR family transcriptional regulator [Tropicimonas sediminicola]SNS84176.1 DNA-binding transcriptional regulator, IclR family [Tropicimonas sediminicola]